MRALDEARQKRKALPSPALSIQYRPMGIGKKILDIVFGKDPDIFDEQGHVLHKLPKKKWDAWHNRTKLDPQYNWRNHTGMTGGPVSKKKS